MNITDANELAAITNVINCYTDAGNRRDLAAMIATFMPDGIWETVAPNGKEIRFSGHEELRNGIGGIALTADMIVQMPHSTTIRVDGDTAQASTTVEERVRRGDQAYIYLGRYSDALVKSDGEWLFALRKFEVIYFEKVKLEGKILAKYPLEF